MTGTSEAFLLLLFNHHPIPRVSNILTSSRTDWFCLALYCYKWNRKIWTLGMASFTPRYVCETFMSSTRLSITVIGWL